MLWYCRSLTGYLGNPLFIGTSRRFTLASSPKTFHRSMSSSLPFHRLLPEAELAVKAVLQACSLTKAVQSSFDQKDAIIKNDKSPVTTADLSAQALISLHLQSKFPSDFIIGEEDTSELRRNDPLRSQVVGLVNEHGKPDSWSEEQILEAIDKGSAEGGPSGRFWTIDPVDGTSGFIRHQQYAVCLALIIDGQVELGVIGCPNLGSKPAAIGEEVIPNGDGVLMIAVKGEGSYSRPLDSSRGYKRLELPSTPPSSNPLTFLESVEAGHSAHSIQARIGELLEVKRPSLRMDSQAKYACLGRGEGGVYLRIPTKYVGGKDYQEKVWDHASGSLLIAESGGICTDMFGKPLDFAKGRTLSANEGIVAAGKDVHPKAIAAVKQSLSESQ